MDYFGAASAGGLSAVRAGAQPGVPVVLGPDLWEDMGEQAFVEALNVWGGNMHREVVAPVSSTQLTLPTTYPG
mgnify:CR=1 FL=1